MYIYGEIKEVLVDTNWTLTKYSVFEICLCLFNQKPQYWEMLFQIKKNIKKKYIF